MNQASTNSKVPLNVDVNLDPIAEDIWAFEKQEDGTSTANQQLVANNGFHSESGVANLHVNRFNNTNDPVYSFITESDNLIELRSTGNDPTSNAPMNGVYLDGKFLDNVPAHGLESTIAVQGNYDDLLLTDGDSIAMKITSNSTSLSPVSGTGGSSWSFVTTGAPAAGWSAPAYGNGVWVSVALTTSTTAGIARSTDAGLTWSFVTTTAPGSFGWLSVAYGNGVWIALAQTASTTTGIARSTDGGLTWSFVTTPIPGGRWNHVSYGDGIWIAVAATTSGPLVGIARSTDGGLTWSFTLHTAPGGNWNAASYGNGVWIAVALTTSTTAGIARSTDGGQNWSFVTTSAPGGSGWRAVFYGDGVWVAVADTTSTTTGIARSTDGGLTWSFVTTPTPSGIGWRSVAFGNGVWVAMVQSTSTTSAIARSTDAGLTWSFVTTTAPAGSWIYVSYGDGVWVILAGTTSTTAGVARSTISLTSSLSLNLDVIDSNGDVLTSTPTTLSGAGFGKPVALVKQALGNSFTSASTQYFLAADSSTTYNIFDQAGVKQLTTSIPVAFAAGAPKYVWAAKFKAKNDYAVLAIGVVGASVPSYMITSTGGAAPFTNTNTALTYSWAVMQSRNTYNRVLFSGQTNPASTSGQHLVLYGYQNFSASYTTSPTLNAITNSTDLTTQPASSSYAYVDIVHTDYQHYYSGYSTPATAALFTNTANSSGPVQGFGRLSWINEADWGAKPPFEFRLNMIKGASTYAASPQFLSVANPYGLNSQVAIGTPISVFGEFDPSWGPQIGANWDQVAWRWADVYYIAKVSTSPSNPIQKITTNLYKINSISPINVVNVSSQALVLGSNDYTSSFLVNGGTNSGTTWGSTNIQWQAGSKTAANSIDVGGVFFYNTGAYTVTPLAFAIPSIHQSYDYFVNSLFTGTGATANTLVQAWRSDGQVLTGTQLLSGFQNQVAGLGLTYVSNTTLVPLPLGVQYSGYTIGTNSSALSNTFYETYVTSGYRGVALTNEWDGYITGNQIDFAAVSFSLFNQPYLFDGKNIYKVVINNGGVQVPITILCRADGLVYMTTSQQYAFFFDSFDNSVWIFDGGYTLNKLKRLDGMGAIRGGNFNAFESALIIDTDTDLVFMRDGVWTKNPKDVLMIPDTSESRMRLYDTIDGTVFGNTFNWWNYQYYAPDAVGTTTVSGIDKISSIVPLNFQTGFIGPDVNERMILSGITFSLYSEALEKIVVTTTVRGYDQDQYFEEQPSVFTINPSAFINGGIFRARIQPKNQRALAASLQIQGSYDFRIYEFEYHWTPESQAVIAASRSV